MASLVHGALDGVLSAVIEGLPRHVHWVLTACAPLVARQVGSLTAPAIALVQDQASRYPDCWLTALRSAVTGMPDDSSLHAARLLSTVGTASDVEFLRAVARSRRWSGNDRDLGRALARQIAPVAIVHDLGRVRIQIGDSEVNPRRIRRKVLAVLCFLLTRPRFSAAREEVMEVMWPDFDPAAALNSLNQSVYYLRRVFEPAFTEETSAGYVQQDSDVLWLDPALDTSSEQNVCRSSC